jgi:hypothetical protein
MIPIATYLPEAMIIGIGPELRIVDENGKIIEFPTATSFGYFFHEYSHYLHNISTASGIAAFINTLELWRNFRLTMSRDGHSSGSAGFPPDRKTHLADLLSYLRAARQRHEPVLKVIQSPDSLTIHSFQPQTDAARGEATLHTILACEAEIADQGGQSERQTVLIGTLEILEGAAWLLEKQLVRTINPHEVQVQPPVFPYRVVVAAAQFAAPGIDEDGILACMLTALQSSDAPDGLVQVLAIARAAIKDESDPVTVLRAEASRVLETNSGRIKAALASLDAEFHGQGVMAGAIRKIIGAANTGFEARLTNPFFELEMVKNLASSAESITDVLRHIPSCAVLQKNAGPDDKVCRDFLLSFVPETNEHGRDPEQGLRVIHSIFNYLARHRRCADFANTKEARRGMCPFYRCCNLPLRLTTPSICKATPWESADWPSREGDTCWYGTAVRICRVPSS